MANSYRPIVNQRLYFCRLHLQMLAEQLAEQQVAKPVLEQALGESVLFHLVLTYRAYMAEIALAYAVDLQPPENAGQLITLLADQGYESAEAQELLAVESDGLWLGELLQQYSELGPVQANIRPRTAATLISATESASSWGFSLSVLQSYFDALSEIIDNQRARLEEW
jgi:hypothetical protein